MANRFPVGFLFNPNIQQRQEDKPSSQSLAEASFIEFGREVTRIKLYGSALQLIRLILKFAATPFAKAAFRQTISAAIVIGLEFMSASAAHGQDAALVADALPSASASPDAEPILAPELPALPKPVALPALPAAPSGLNMEVPVDNLEPSVKRPIPWRVDLGLQTSTTYDDNIFIQHEHKSADVYFGITPVVSFIWGKPLTSAATLTGVVSRFQSPTDPQTAGDTLMLRYAPTANFFVKHSDQNSFDEDVELDGRVRAAKTLLEFEARFQTLHSPDVDVGNRIEQETTSAFAEVIHDFTAKTAVDSKLSVDHTSYQGGLDFSDVVERLTLEYKLTPKTTLGAGGAVGYTDVEDGANQLYEQGLLHLHYVPTEKITTDLLGGVEFRQIQDVTSRTSPVASFTASYAAGQSTVILLDVSQRTETSAIFESQDLDRTTVEANLRQLLFQKVYLTIGGGYQHIRYIDAGAAANRADNFFYFGSSVAMDLTKWMSVRMNYRYQNNHSNQSEFAFDRNVADLQFNVQF